MPSKSAFIIEGCFFEKNFRENEVFSKMGVQKPLCTYIYLWEENSQADPKREKL